MINLYVASEYGAYRPWGQAVEAEALNGLQVKESANSGWEVIPSDGIIGFTYVPGYEYRLKVKKTHLANPPADASNIRYTLINIISKEYAN